MLLHANIGELHTGAKFRESNHSPLCAMSLNVYSQFRCICNWINVYMARNLNFQFILYLANPLTKHLKDVIPPLNFSIRNFSIEWNIESL
jgi:hypothetical protein